VSPDVAAREVRLTAEVIVSRLREQAWRRGHEHITGMIGQRRDGDTERTRT